MSIPQKFNIELPDKSAIFGTAVFIGTDLVGITQIYHEAPMTPDYNGVPVASHLTNLIGLVPAILSGQQPFKNLATRIKNGERNE